MKWRGWKFSTLLFVNTASQMIEKRAAHKQRVHTCFAVNIDFKSVFESRHFVVVVLWSQKPNSHNHLMITSHLIDTFIDTTIPTYVHLLCVCVALKISSLNLCLLFWTFTIRRSLTTGRRKKDRFIKSERVDFYAVDLLLSSTLQAQQ